MDKGEAEKMATGKFKPTSNRSSVWKYFDQQDENTVQCNIYTTSLVYHKSTATMINHLKYKHPTAALKESEDGGTKQTTITYFACSRRHCDTSRSEKTTDLIAKMTAKDMLPISFVHGEGFGS